MSCDWSTQQQESRESWLTSHTVSSLCVGTTNKGW